MEKPAEVVICGAGIAGISAAYHLAVRQGLPQVVLVDERPPLSLTSDKSTECYRNWWPGPGNAMVAMMNRSIDLLETLAEASNNCFHFNRRGYLYLTADESRLPAFIQAAEVPPSLGAGPLRVYRGRPNDPYYQPSPVQGYRGVPEGADLFLDPALIQRRFPSVTPQAIAGLHVRRAGWFSAQQLGRYLLDKARAAGVQLLQDRVVSVETNGGRVQAVRLQAGGRLAPDRFVNAAGPFVGPIANLLDIELPVYTELHLKAAVHDPLGVIDRAAPLLIWSDPQRLPWEPAARAFLESEPDLHWLLDELPNGVHTRPEGGHDSDMVLMLWEYQEHQLTATFPPPLDEQYPEIVLRGLATMLPGLQAYFQRLPQPALDGGYYTRTRENRPLIGPLAIEGAYVIGALSGYGLMAACAAGELLAAHLTGAALPEYAPAFHPNRYQDPAYQRLLADWGTTGQL
jgi:glycine/D-amino acid oxidase-like deaminating enzyme